jgi:cytochrome c2
MITNKILIGAVVASCLSTGAFAKNYTQGEIYQVMCQKCHGKFAEGNPKKKGPSLIDMTESELAVDIFELDDDGYQSSGSSHDKMGSNMEIIRKKGMDVDADKMAKYIFDTFGKK